MKKKPFNRQSSTETIKWHFTTEHARKLNSHGYTVIDNELEHNIALKLKENLLDEAQFHSNKLKTIIHKSNKI
jgi:hypothetical protein